MPGCPCPLSLITRPLIVAPVSLVARWIGGDGFRIEGDELGDLRSGIGLRPHRGDTRVIGAELCREPLRLGS